MILRKIIHQNWFIALAATLQCVASFAFDSNTPLQVLYYSLAIGFATKATYTFLRSAHAFSHKKQMQKLFVSQSLWLLLSALFLYLSALPFQYYSILFIAILCTVFYGSHFLYQNKKHALRSFPIGKVVVISLVWVLLTVLLPLLWNQAFTQRDSIYLLMQFLFIALLTIPFDFYDATSQQEQGFTTLVSKYGVESTKKICRALAILCWICSGFLGLPFLLVMSVLVLVYLRFIRQINSDWSFEKYSLYFDGLLILQAVLLIAINFL